MSRGMQLEQVKRKIPSVLFSWDTYSVSREGQSLSGEQTLGMWAALSTHAAVLKCII